MNLKLNSLYILFFLAILTSCASTQSCPSVEDEPVSTCRAHEACGTHSFAGFASAAFGGLNSGGALSSCIDRELQAQAINNRR